MGHRFAGRLPFGFPLARARTYLSFACATLMAAAMTGSAFAQGDAPPGSIHDTEILFLGTAGGPPLRLDRYEPSTLLIVDGRPYLIDCGIGTMQRLLQAGMKSESINTIFFTHLHADHDLGLADVMGNDFFRLNEISSSEMVNIYGPPQTRQLVDAGFHYITYGYTAFAAEPGAIHAGLRHGKLTSPFAAHEIEHDGLVYQDDRIRVVAAENTHYVLMSPQSRQTMKSYSYRIETPYGAVVFTGDTGPSEAVVRLAKNADVLVSEVEDLDQATRFVNRLAANNHWPAQRTAMMLAHMRQAHLSEKEVGEMATRAHVKAVVLYHYNPVDPAAHVAAVRKYFSGPVFASADLARYCLDKPRIGEAQREPVLSVCRDNSNRPKAHGRATTR